LLFINIEDVVVAPRWGGLRWGVALVHVQLLDELDRSLSSRPPCCRSPGVWTNDRA
jgi:hypothetical protein